MNPSQDFLYHTAKDLAMAEEADVIPLLETCPKTALDEFETKIDLAARIAQPQARLNLV